jgi:hypothetical protein
MPRVIAALLGLLPVVSAPWSSWSRRSEFVDICRVGDLDLDLPQLSSCRRSIIPRVSEVSGWRSVSPRGDEMSVRPPRVHRPRSKMKEMHHERRLRQ